MSIDTRPCTRKYSQLIDSNAENELVCVCDSQTQAGVIHNIGFTYGSQDMFYAFLPLMHICTSNLGTSGTYDCDVPRLRCYSYFCSSNTSLPI